MTSLKDIIKKIFFKILRKYFICIYNGVKYHSGVSIPLTSRLSEIDSRQLLLGFFLIKK